LLNGVAGAHLIGHRTDAADTRDDIGHLVEVAPFQHLFEQARRLEDAQLQINDCSIANRQVERPFTFDTGQQWHVDGHLAPFAHDCSFMSHCRASLCSGSLWLWINRKRRAIASGSKPNPAKRCAKAWVLRASAGPKQP
jgi:hypothetical protein